MGAKRKTKIEPGSRYRNNFEQRRRQVSILAGISVAGLAAIAVLIFMNLTRLRWGLFVLWLACSAVLAIVAYGLWRCPKCQKFLGLTLKRDHCPGCSLKFRD